MLDIQWCPEMRQLHNVELFGIWALDWDWPILRVNDDGIDLEWPAPWMPNTMYVDYIQEWQEEASCQTLSE